MNMLEVNNVSKIYGSLHALSEVNLTVEEGKWLSIMGPSGSGKTTLMNIIGCMDKPSLGSVILDGQDITQLSLPQLTEIRRDKIGLIFQQFHLVSYLTALENVMVAQYYHSMVDEKEALQALERVGLAARAKHLPRQLSGGEQQRVCNEAMVMNLLHQLHEEGSTIIVVTHSPEVSKHAQTTVVLEHGKVASIINN